MAGKPLKTSKRPVKRSKEPVRRRPSRKPEETIPRTRIRVIGVGGGGSSIVAEISQRVHKADFVAANTDEQALKELPRKVRIFSFGHALTKGLGCGMDVECGFQAAETEKERIRGLFEGQDVCILIASLGGGTASGALPVFAEAAKEAKNLTIGIFTLPFSFEGEKRSQIAQEALERVKPQLNAHIIIPNERIFGIIEKQTSLRASLSSVNKILADTLEGLIETISTPGLINIDFADLRSSLEGRGRLAYLYTITAQGSAKGADAVKRVLANPLCEYTIEGVDRILFNITGDKRLTMQEVATISRAISTYNAKARIIFGISMEHKMKNRLRITLFATGCKEQERSIFQSFRKTRPAKKKRGVFSKKPQTPPQEPVATKKRPKRKKKPPVAPVPPPEAQKPEEQPQQKKPEPPRQRRNALDLKKAVDEEMHELEEQERQWDIPAFLKNRLGF